MGREQASQLLYSSIPFARSISLYQPTIFVSDFYIILISDKLQAHLYFPIFIK